MDDPYMPARRETNALIRAWQTFDTRSGDWSRVDVQQDLAHLRTLIDGYIARGTSTAAKRSYEKIPTTKGERVSRRPRLRSSQDTVDAPRKRYSNATAERVMRTYRDLERIDDVVTISAIARRTGVSRSTVRAVLRQECAWTPAQSRRAHRAGVRRGKLLQAVAGHPGLAKGRETLQLQGWPNLQRGHQALQASEYSALKQGRLTQACSGWPGLMAATWQTGVHRIPSSRTGTGKPCRTGLAQLEEGTDRARIPGLSSAARCAATANQQHALAADRSPRTARTNDPPGNPGNTPACCAAVNWTIWCRTATAPSETMVIE